MRRVGRIATRLLIVVISVAVGIALVEGAYSLVTGGSLVTRILSGAQQTASLRTGLFDEERIDAADLTVGSRAVDPDGEVGFTMKWSHEVEIVGALARTDRFGQRLRAGPEPHPDATRIVLLGDSVAFGYGVTDDQTFGHHLETYLAGTMAEGRPPPVVYTVACPGWNLRAQLRYLKNHLGRLDPDIVVHLPVTNDLDDQYRVNELGRDEPGFDPALGPDSPHINTQQFWRLLRITEKDTPRSVQLRRKLAGGLLPVQHLTLTGMFPESQRRWAATRTRMRDLRARLAERGVKLMIALRFPYPFELMFDEMARESLADVPLTYLLSGEQSSDRLETDSHPNSRFTRAGGWRMAKAILGLGWIPGAGAQPLADVDPDYRDRQFEPPTNEKLKGDLGKLRTLWTDFLEPEVDLTTGIGFHQVYGGVGPRGNVGRQLLVGLKNPGDAHVLLELSRLPADSGLYPFTITAWVNGTPSGTRPVPAPDADDADDASRTVLTFPVPGSERDAEFVDVRFLASNWVVQEIFRKSAVVSWNLVRIGFTDDAGASASDLSNAGEKRRANAEDLGFGKGLGSDAAPRLRVEPGDARRPPTLMVEGAPKSSPGYVVFSTTRRPSPAYGGTMVPDRGTARRVPATTDDQGRCSVPIPDDLHLVEVYVQAGFGTTKANAALTNALRVRWR